ncbi:MAG: NADH-quinone oxidoreductase subunit M [Pseudomonadota bacterium]
MDNLLSITIFIPAIAAAILGIFLRGDDAEAQGNAKWVALIATSMTFIVSLFIVFEFDPGDSGFQYVEETDWPLGLTYKVGVDGISLALVMLTTFLMPLVVAASWTHANRTKGFVIALLCLETMVLGAFLSLDLVLFFVFAEGALVPLMVVLGIWGGENGRASALKLMFYALPGASLMVVAMAAMAFDAQTTDIEALTTHNFNADSIFVLGIEVPGGGQTLMAAALVLSFASKIPLWPLHAWAAEIYARVPTGAAMVAAGLLVKIGGYGMLRFLYPILPQGAEILAPILVWLSVITLLYAATAALVQTNILRLLAYMSVAHTALISLAIFSGTQQGIDGAIFQMVSHGLVIAALMVSAGVLYDRVESHDMKAFGGIATRMPFFAFGTMMIMLASLGLPGTSGFAALFLTMVGAAHAYPLAALLAMLGLVISAAALLSMYKRVVFGPLIKQSLKSISDLDRREKTVFAALLAMILYLGLFPGLVTDFTSASVEAVLAAYEQAQPVTDEAQ